MLKIIILILFINLFCFNPDSYAARLRKNKKNIKQIEQQIKLDAEKNTQKMILLTKQQKDLEYENKINQLTKEYETLIQDDQEEFKKQLYNATQKTLENELELQKIKNLLTKKNKQVLNNELEFKKIKKLLIDNTKKALNTELELIKQRKLR